MASLHTDPSGTSRQFWFRATWGSCVAVLFAPAIVPMPNANARWFALAGVLLFVFGVIQAIRNELYKAERLKAIARGMCPACGCDIGNTGNIADRSKAGAGDDATIICPSCGETVGG